MAQVPPDSAPRDESGNYWWDGAAWQPVPGSAADPANAGVAAATGAAAAGAAGGDERATAKTAQGLPETPDLLGDQLATYVSKEGNDVELVDSDMADVVAMEDTGDGSGGSVA